MRIELNRVERTRRWVRQRSKARLVPRNGENSRDEQWWSRTRWSSHAATGWRSARPRPSTIVIKWYEPPECIKVREPRGWWPCRRGSSDRVFNWVTPRQRRSSIGTYIYHFYLIAITPTRRIRISQWQMTDIIWYAYRTRPRVKYISYYFVGLFSIYITNAMV